MSVVHRVEPGMDRRSITATTYQMRNFFKQLGDGYFTNLDVFNYIQHHAIVMAMRRDDRVLDMCCGRGLLLPLMRYHRKDVAEYVGVDISEANIKRARTHAASASGQRVNPALYYPFRTRWINSNVARMADHLDHGSFDVVVYTSAIEHMQKADGARSILEAWKLARPGARMYLSTPRTPEDKDGYDTQYAAHVYEWKLPELRHELRQVGWRIVSETGLFANVRDLDEKVAGLGDPGLAALYKHWKGYLPREWLTAFMAVPFPEISREVLIVATR